MLEEAAAFIKVGALIGQGPKLGSLRHSKLFFVLNPAWVAQDSLRDERRRTGRVLGKCLGHLNACLEMGKQADFLAGQRIAAPLFQNCRDQNLNILRCRIKIVTPESFRILLHVVFLGVTLRVLGSSPIGQPYIVTGIKQSLSDRGHIRVRLFEVGRAIVVEACGQQDWPQRLYSGRGFP